MRALPARLALWQHRETLEGLPHRLATLLAETLRVRWVAIDVAGPDGEWRSAARLGDAEDVAILDRMIDDDGIPVARMRIGARSDGSGLLKDKRDLIASLDLHLATALAGAQRHSAQEARLKMLIDGLQALAASRPRTSSTNRITEIGLET